MSEWWGGEAGEVAVDSGSVIWPQMTDYLTAIEAHQVDVDGPLGGWTAVDGGFLGGPLALSGRSAAVFCMEDPSGERHAVRCFLGEPAPNLRAICELTREAGHTLPSGIIDWHERGLLIDGAWWPVLAMPWFEGKPLDLWVWDHRHDPAALSDLANRIVDLVHALDGDGLVHGDLQHGNVLIGIDGTINLVDLDGLVRVDPGSGAPAAGWVMPTEAGHPNYQHPERTLTRGWWPTVDLFSTLVIDLSLRAIAAEPEMMDRFYQEDNLLLTADDLADPSASKLFEALAAIPDELVQIRRRQVQTFCRQTLDGSYSARQVLLDGLMPNGPAYEQPWWTIDASTTASTGWSSIPPEATAPPPERLFNSPTVIATNATPGTSPTSRPALTWALAITAVVALVTLIVLFTLA